jgi:hypothetical protein
MQSKDLFHADAAIGVERNFHHAYFLNALAAISFR